MNGIGVYILLCRNRRYYVGSTNNSIRRLNEHNAGKVKATKNILPVQLVFSQDCDTLTEARRLENIIKKKKSKSIIDKIVKDGFIKFVQR